MPTPIHQALFVSVDVETTGLNPDRDAIVEVAAVKVQSGKIIDEFCTLVSIDRPIPTSAHRIHGISDDMLVGKPSIREAMQSLLSFVGQGVMVEHSHRAFDILFLEAAHGSALPCLSLNTCALSRRLFPHIPSHSLKECCKRFRIEHVHAHRALSDAHATAHLLLRLLELCPPRYAHLEDLVSVASVQR